MLIALYIKNFAIIEEQDLVFKPGLNILTGETGAGKSIIVDALMMALGERASADFIRTGESKAIVEATFDISGNSSALNYANEQEFEVIDNQLIIRREISAKGSSRCFINDSPVSVGSLKQLGDLLVDFHGQHEHQSLLNADNHLKVIDSLIPNKSVFDDYLAIFNEYKSKLSELKLVIDKKDEYARKKTLNEMILNEIDKVSPTLNEDQELEKKLKLMENAELIYNTAQSVYFSLLDENNSVYSKMTTAAKDLERLANLDPLFNDYTRDFKSALITIKETADFAHSRMATLEFEPQSVESTRDRLIHIRGLMKKHGSIEDILKLRETIVQELDWVNNFDDKIYLVKSDIERLRLDLGELSGKISSLRLLAGKFLEKSIMDSLKELGMENAIFTSNFTLEAIELKKIENIDFPVAIVDGHSFRAYRNGIENCEFYIAANTGEKPGPLAQIASGGEISRIMLALKAIAADADGTPTLIFDEIDTGVSGRIGQKVGFVMKKLAATKQIISITHLAQIAALGDLNIHVSKTEKAGRTYTHAKVLDSDDKVIEIAKMISGEEVTAASKLNAEELINVSNQFNN